MIASFLLPFLFVLVAPACITCLVWPTSIVLLPIVALRDARHLRRLT